jgi:hypothetical protein
LASLTHIKALHRVAVIDFSGSQAARQVPENIDIPNEVLQ